MSGPFPTEMMRIGDFSVTDTVVTSAALSIFLVGGARVAMRIRRARAFMEVAYAALENSVRRTVDADIGPLVPLILTQWIFIGAANLVGLVPRLASPTRDLALTAALALISFFAGHVHAWRARGFVYLRQYLEPTPLLLPLNLIGEISRTVALALRLFGNTLSGGLVSAIALYLGGLLLPVPLMLLSVLTGVVQAYIFGILTLVFAASSLEIARRPHTKKDNR